MTPLARWAVLTFLIIPFGVWSLELGDIEVWSSVNQPLEADIQLISATPDEVAGLRVSLAGPEDFERYAVDDSILTSTVQFRVDQDSLGRDLIKVSSSESITEPSLTLLVEAIWPQGSLIRSYTVLFDSQTPVPPAGFYGPVQLGETLWAISERHLPAGATMHQMMVATYEANAEAFNGNMNILLQGSLLRIVESAELSTLVPSVATAEVQRQREEWSSGDQQARLRLVAPQVSNVAAGVSTQTDGSAAVELGQLRGEVQALRELLEETRILLTRRDEQIQELLARFMNAPPLIGSASEAETIVPTEPELIPLRKPETQVVIVEPEGPSLFSRILSRVEAPLAWIVLGIAALLGAAVWYLRYRNEDVADIPGRLDVPEVTSDGSAGVENSSGTPIMEEVGTKLDLARAYIDMGDVEGARGILGEVLSAGDKQQKEEAQGLLNALSA